MKLTKTELAPLPLLSIDGEAEDRRNELALEARQITSIATPEQNDKARNICVEIRTHLKEVEAERVVLNKPLRAAQAMVNDLAAKHGEPLQAELDRLQRLAATFLQAEQVRVAAEMKARLELAAEAKTDEDFNVISNEAMPSAARATGQQFKRVFKYEVLDIHAVYLARPELCKLEIKASAVNATCVPEIPVPGLKMSWQNVALFTTRT